MVTGQFSTRPTSQKCDQISNIFFQASLLFMLSFDVSEVVVSQLVSQTNFKAVNSILIEYSTIGNLQIFSGCMYLYQSAHTHTHVYITNWRTEFEFQLKLPTTLLLERHETTCSLSQSDILLNVSSLACHTTSRRVVECTHSVSTDTHQFLIYTDDNRKTLLTPSQN